MQFEPCLGASTIDIAQVFVAAVLFEKPLCVTTAKRKVLSVNQGWAENFSGCAELTVGF
jgi:hypothetical protein